MLEKGKGLDPSRGNARNNTGVHFHWCRVQLYHMSVLCIHMLIQTEKCILRSQSETGANCSHLSLLYQALLPSSRNSSLKGINITQHDWRTIDPLGLKHFLLLSLVKIEIKVFFRLSDIVHQLP